MSKQVTREQAIADAVNAIDGQIASVEARLDRAIELNRPDFHVRYLRGALEGLEMAREAMPTAHLVPKLEETA